MDGVITDTIGRYVIEYFVDVEVRQTVAELLGKYKGSCNNELANDIASTILLLRLDLW